MLPAYAIRINGKMKVVLILRKLHLVCNAHLDPVWQWDWPEGIGAVLSTFSVVADFCEEFDRFVFCHNESVLYEWIEEYDPALFKRIQALVKQKKWHIMGGWYLQPDCNMPAGESLVRQISKGLCYFKEKFDARPTVAISMDAFGHSKGLVQILQQAGYDGYMFMRPDLETNHVELPQRFCWEGYNGSRVKGFRLNSSYNTLFGRGAEAVENYIKYNQDECDILRCWGVGDHGGGPSRKDIIDINNLIDTEKDTIIFHSTPETFFDGLDLDTLPVYDKDLNPIDVGCYTTMHKVKMLHRRLENALAIAEKLSSVCELYGLVDYPVQEIEDAWTDLLFGEFHDILPGTAVKPAEEHAIQRLYHGLEIADKVINRAHYALAYNEAPAQGKDIPLFIVNPHPYEISDVFECEYMLADQNWSGTFEAADVYCGDQCLPTQMEKEHSTINLDWRKKLSFYGKLKPLSVTRFDCRLKSLDANPFKVVDLSDGKEHVIETGRVRMVMDSATGCFNSLQIDGVEYGGAGLGRLTVYKDNCDPWLLEGRVIDEFIGEFTLLDPKESAVFGGSLGEELSPVRIIEEGDVRTCIEVLTGYKTSRAKVVYKLSKHGGTLEVEIILQWNEKDSMVRFFVPHSLKMPTYSGQDIFGVKPLSTTHEMVAQKWVMASDGIGERAMGIINDCTYGSKLNDDSFEVSLLRSPSYTCFHIEKNPPTSHERSLPRIDRGESSFNFTIVAGPAGHLEECIDQIAQIKNEAPRAVSYFPSGNGDISNQCFTVEGVRMDTLKKSADGQDYILRLFNEHPHNADARIRIKALHIDEAVPFAPFELKTLRLSNGRMCTVDLIDET